MNKSKGRVKAKGKRFCSTEKLAITEAKRINDTMVFETHLKLHTANMAVCMGAMAVHFGEDREYWEAVGYLHGYDYGKFPEKHLLHTERGLLAKGMPAEDVRAILSHGYGHRNEVEPESKIEKSLYTVDKLNGIIQTATHVRPDDIADMDIKSFMKKSKSEGFATKCNHEIILKGCEMLGIDIKEVTEIAITGMEEHTEESQLTEDQA